MPPVATMTEGQLLPTLHRLEVDWAIRSRIKTQYASSIADDGRSVYQGRRYGAAKRWRPARIVPAFSLLQQLLR